MSGAWKETKTKNKKKNTTVSKNSDKCSPEIRTMWLQDTYLCCLYSCTSRCFVFLYSVEFKCWILASGRHTLKTLQITESLHERLCFKIFVHHSQDPFLKKDNAFKIRNAILRKSSATPIDNVAQRSQKSIARRFISRQMSKKWNVERSIPSTAQSTRRLLSVRKSNKNV
jgi:hypothetical protein